MRIYTLVLSVLAHVAAIVAVYIAPAFATDVLPEPPRTTTYVIVDATLPDPTPPSIKRPEITPPTSAAPTEPPDGVLPERHIEPVDNTPFDDPGALVVGPIGAIGPVGNLLPAPPLPPRPNDPVPVGGVIRPPKKVAHVAPNYPPIALAARKGGLVILQAVIDENGAVREVKVLRSDPLFDQAAMDAVRQWRFTPTLLNGQPVPIVMTVTVGFSPNE